LVRKLRSPLRGIHVDRYLKACICYPQLSIIHYPHMRMQIVVLGYADAVMYCISIPFI
jgi:hypothetical protein